jgi:hypothetical protein
MMAMKLRPSQSSTIHDQETVELNIPGEIGNPDLLNNGDEATGEAPEASGEDNE